MVMNLYESITLETQFDKKASEIIETVVSNVVGGSVVFKDSFIDFYIPLFDIEEISVFDILYVLSEGCYLEYLKKNLNVKNGIKFSIDGNRICIM